MKNRLIFPDRSLYKPDQRARILDVWSGPSIGLLDMHSQEYVDLFVNQVYGRGAGENDVRFISLKPVEESEAYKLVKTESGDTNYQKLNPRINPDEVRVERGRFSVKRNSLPIERLSLVTKVTPKRGAMTHCAVIDVNPILLTGETKGRIWASEEREKFDEHLRRYSHAWSL